MVTVVFHWGAHERRASELQKALDEGLNWFKSQPGFVMGVTGQDVYNPVEMLSCVEWDIKEHADQAFAKWEQAGWRNRLQPMLSRPVSFVTYNTTGTFAPKGAQVPGMKEPTAGRKRQETSVSSARGAGMTSTRTTKASTGRETKAGMRESKETKTPPPAKPRERAVGTESRARTSKR